MRVFNKRTRIVEETLNIRFLENTPNVTRNGPDWLFDVDSLTISMNYVPVVAGNQTNGIAGTRDNIVTGQAEKKTEPEQKYILIPIYTTNPLISQDPKVSKEDAEEKPTEMDENCDNHDLSRCLNAFMWIMWEIGSQSIKCDHLNEIEMVVRLVKFISFTFGDKEMIFVV
ncbi:hypothetical protein Tco_0714746 [Tanacetum coccineum]